MIPFTLLCLALFALAWGCYSAWRRAQRLERYWKSNAEWWFNRAMKKDMDFTRPMSCEPFSVQSCAPHGRKDVRWSSLDDLMRSGKADG